MKANGAAADCTGPPGRPGIVGVFNAMDVKPWVSQRQGVRTELEAIDGQALDGLGARDDRCGRRRVFMRTREAVGAGRRILEGW